MPATSLKNVILEILRQAGDAFHGKTRLYKACYFAHLYYYEDAPGILSECDFARLPQGPGIHDGHVILSELRRAGWIEYRKAHEGPYPEYRYSITEKGKAQLQDFPAKARQAIEKSMQFIGDKSAVFLSECTHEYSRSWNEAKNGDTLDIYIDIIPDDEFEQRKIDLEKDRPLLDQLSAILEG